MALTKFSQAVIGISIVAGAGFGASYMANSPYIDNALAKLNEKSVQVIEREQQAKLIKEQEQAQLLVLEQKQKAEKERLNQIEEQRKIEFEQAKAKHIEKERLQLEEAVKKMEQRKQEVQQSNSNAVLPDEVKQHILDERNKANQQQPTIVEKTNVDPAMAKLLGQSSK